jgi:hypothetical protein
LHLEESGGAFTTEPAVTTCYEAKFSYYGIMGSPRRIACPPGATPIIPPPAEPEPEIAIPDGADAGVALWERDGRGCLLGARVGGQVLVRRPSRVQLQPGELSCDPQTALARQGIHPRADG